MVVDFEGEPSQPIVVPPGPLRPPGPSGSVVAAAIVVWIYALLGTLLGLGMFAAAAGRYPYRNSDMVVGLLITALSWGNVVLGVFLVRGLGWARIAVDVLAVFWFVVEIYAALTLEVRVPFLVLAVVNLVLLVLLNNGRARAYFAARRRWRRAAAQ